MSFVSKLISADKIPLYQVNLKTADEQKFWCLIYITKAKLRELESVMLNSPKLSDYGKIIYSGFGDNPPEYILEKIKKEKLNS